MQIWFLYKKAGWPKSRQNPGIPVFLLETLLYRNTPGRIPAGGTGMRPGVFRQGVQPGL